MSKPTYKLDIIDGNGGVFTVIGNDDLRKITEIWTNEAFEPLSRRFVVSGFSDDGRQRPITISLERETVKGLILEELI